MTKMNGGWLISAGSVGKSKKGMSISSAPRNAAACWQLRTGSAGALPGVQARQVWHDVLAALVGDV